jgi:hypothetical protein
VKFRSARAPSSASVAAAAAAAARNDYRVGPDVPWCSMADKQVSVFSQSFVEFDSEFHREQSDTTAVGGCLGQCVANIDILALKLRIELYETL